jgi:hypothetical protein
LDVGVADGFVLVRGVKSDFSGDTITVDSADGTKYVWIQFLINEDAPGTITLETGTAWPSSTVDLNTYGYIVVATVEVKNSGILSLRRRWFAGDVYFPGL